MSAKWSKLSNYPQGGEDENKVQVDNLKQCVYWHDAIYIVLSNVKNHIRTIELKIYLITCNSRSLIIKWWTQVKSYEASSLRISFMQRLEECHKKPHR